MSKRLKFEENWRPKPSLYPSSNYTIKLILGLASIIFLNRVGVPDTSFDSTNYHYFAGFDLIKNFPNLFSPGEFFPLGIRTFNPIPDFPGALLANLIGYRLGTTFSLVFYFALVLAGYKLILLANENAIEKRLVLLLFPIFLVNDALFQLATYFTDILFASMTVVAALFLIKLKSSRRPRLTIFLLGLALAVLMMKTTNVFVVAPIVILATFEIWRLHQDKLVVQRLKNVIVSMATLLVPAVIANAPFISSILVTTGNPVFPYFNSLFKSKLYPPIDWQFNMGPTDAVQRIFYPIYALTNPARLGEVQGLYPDVKIIFTFWLVVGCLISIRILKISVPSRTRILSLLSISAFFLWQIAFGYTRYAIGLEVLLGATFLLLATKLVNHGRSVGVALNFAVASLLIISVANVALNTRYDMSWRPPINGANFLANVEWHSILKKYTDLDSRQTKKLASVDFILQCAEATSAYTQTLKPLMDKPLLNFDQGSNGLLNSNVNYIVARNQELMSLFPSQETFEFAAVVNLSSESGRLDDQCNLNLESSSGIQILESFKVGNFVGSKNSELKIYLGKFDPSLN